MKGTFIKERSWEKQRYFRLDNGFTICTESMHDGRERVARIEHGSEVWCACNGRETLPKSFEWALAWVKPIAEGHWQTVMFPDFECVWED